ncbi:MAG: HPF/RaiA family ribosome-associated protein [Actinomycetota bacterium]|nr:HPF/RaiA family ribosome-associated protein [Actinomycetota bacterium]
MRISVSAPGDDLTQTELDRIEADLAKIDRRLNGFTEEIAAVVRVTPRPKSKGHHVVVELDYGRTHLIAKAENDDIGIAVREAREELLRQINDRSRGGHSSFAKRAR